MQGIHVTTKRAAGASWTWKLIGCVTEEWVDAKFVQGDGKIILK